MGLIDDIRNLGQTTISRVLAQAQTQISEVPRSNHTNSTTDGRDGQPRFLGSGAQIRRGFINNSHIDRIFYFWYNPNEVALAYNMRDLVPPDDQTASETSARLLIDGVSMSFNLIVDRTWDMAFGNDAIIKRIGVLYDIMVLDAVIGAVDGVLIPSYDLQIQISPQMTFTGWVTQCNVNFTRFDAKMVPQRAAISLGVQRRLDMASLDPSSLVGSGLTDNNWRPGSWPDHSPGGSGGSSSSSQGAGPSGIATNVPRHVVGGGGGSSFL